MNDQLGILLYDYVQPMDVIGPWEVFSFWKNILQAPIDMCLISEHGGLVQCDNGITLKATYDFEHAPQLDYLIVPGGRGRFTQVNNETLINFINTQAQGCKYLLSICTGMFLLYKAGLLDKKLVTTYWRALPEAQGFKNIHITEQRIVKNENIWLCSGVTSGIDLALELIRELDGKEAAGKLQLLLEYFPNENVYTTADMVHSLPPYGDQEHNPYLPEYIKHYLETKKN